MADFIHISKIKTNKCRKISVRMKEELVDGLDMLANKACISRSELIRILLTEALKRVTTEE